VANKIHVCEHGSHILDAWTEPEAETFAVCGKHYTQDKRSIPIEKRRVVVGGVESEDETVEDDSQTGQDGDDLSPTMRR
jgi:hypothetical protein